MGDFFDLWWLMAAAAVGVGAVWYGYKRRNGSGPTKKP